jgi:peptidoglycan/LPS O-acetylase OafA/YrhL
MSATGRLPFSRTTASVLLDAARGIAAILVCLEHWRGLLFVDYSQLHVPHKALYALPYVLTGAGHQAVVIFFVLSGYLISGSVFRLFTRGEWSWRRYLTHRLVRLWLVLVPALVLGAVFDFSGLHSHLAPQLYAGHVPNHMVDNVGSSLTPLSFAGNLAFTQGILVHTFGSNGPLWSLANEFWYYILFPCALLALRRDSTWRTRLISAALFAGCAWFAGREILLLFPVWLLGTAIAALRVPEIPGWLRAAIALAYLPLFFFLAKTHLVQGVLSDYLLGAATLVFVLALLGASSAAPDAAWARLSKLTARFSYTLYLVHVPLLVLLAAATVGDTRWTPDLHHLPLAVAELIAPIAFSWGVACVTEFRTDKVRGWVETRVLPARERPMELPRAG